MSRGFNDGTDGVGVQMYWVTDETAASHALFLDDVAQDTYMTAHKNPQLRGYVPLLFADKITTFTSTLGLTNVPNGGSSLLIERLHPYATTTLSSTLIAALRTTVTHELYHNLLNAAGAAGFDPAGTEHVTDGNANLIQREPADQAYLMYPELNASNIGTIKGSNADRRELSFFTGQMTNATSR